MFRMHLVYLFLIPALLKSHQVFAKPVVKWSLSIFEGKEKVIALQNSLHRQAIKDGYYCEVSKQRENDPTGPRSLSCGKGEVFISSVVQCGMGNQSDRVQFQILVKDKSELAAAELNCKVIE